MIRRLLLVLAAAPVLAQTPVPAVAVVASAGTAWLLPEGTLTELTLRTGDLLFPGDRVTVDEGPVSLWHCAAGQAFGMEGGASARIEARRVATIAGRVSAGSTLPFCPVPVLARSQLARPVQFGQQVSRYRAVLETPEDERASLAPAARIAMENELRVIAASSAVPFLKDAAIAAVLARYGIHGEAAAAYDRLASEATGVDWPRRLVHEERETRARGKPAPGVIGGGTTYALLVGVSSFSRLPSGQFLQFADRDALSMYELLRSARGGSVPAENIRLLRNADATVSAVRTTIADFLRARAGRNDTVLLFFATHGVAQTDGAFLVGYDSDPGNLRDSGIDLAEVQSLLETEFENVGRVLLFLDVCRAGLVGSIPNGRLGRYLEVFGRLQHQETFGLLASGPGENSKESARFGGGHGAFSYFLLNAFNGAADNDGDSQVSADETYDYVHAMVRKATNGDQRPRVTGDMPGRRILIEDTKRPGIELGEWQPQEVSAAVRGAPQDSAVPWFVLPPRPGIPDVRAFQDAFAAGRLLPSDPNGAGAILRRLAGTLPPLEMLLLENRYRIALEDRGQQILLRYLRGEEATQRREDFEEGAALFEAALALDTAAQALASRAWFCRARALLFENRFDEARQLLERAARVEPAGPYIYNALGLLYLQQAAFSKATAAFRDAILLAPYWSYPRHNLALTLGQTGSYNDAIAAYADARRISPQAWFIPYNLGLVQQRVGRRRDAETSFRAAAVLAPGKPEPETAMGYLAALRGKTREAEQYYRQAMAKDSSFLPARHNLALLFAEMKREAEAIVLWEGVLRDDDTFMASRLAMAGVLQRQGRNQESLAHYLEALKRDPGLTAARLAAARLQLAMGRLREPEEDMRQLLSAQPSNLAAREILADALSAQGKAQEAIGEYDAAEKLAAGDARRAIRRKAELLRKRKM